MEDFNLATWSLSSEETSEEPGDLRFSLENTWEKQ